MRIGVISDIHGNLVALDAVLADLAAEEVDRLVCLGDVAAGGPEPREVVARLRDLGCLIVLGNADAAFLAPPLPSPAAALPDEDARRLETIFQWGAGQLTPDDMAFLRTFRPTLELSLGNGADLLCYHGSPRSYDDIIDATTPDEAVAPMLAGHRATVMAGGHWHFQMLRQYDDAALLNPGSVGLAYDRRPPAAPIRHAAWAEYAVVGADAGRLSIDLRRVPFDVDRLVRLILASGMPHAAWWAAEWR